MSQRTRNTLSDLNNILFEQLEILSDPDLKSEELDREINKSKAMVQISDKIIAAGKLQLDGFKFAIENGKETTVSMPRVLEG